MSYGRDARNIRNTSSRRDAIRIGMTATAEVVATARIPGTSTAVRATGSTPAQERTGTSGNAGNTWTPELVETPVKEV
jgi:hypothetical protein